MSVWKTKIAKNNRWRLKRIPESCRFLPRFAINRIAPNRLAAYISTMGEKATFFQYLYRWGFLIAAALLPFTPIATAYWWPESKLARIYEFTVAIVVLSCIIWGNVVFFRNRAQKKKKALASAAPPSTSGSEE